jgi:hypothetical protein
MPRGISSGTLAALTGSILYPAIFVQLSFTTTNVYIWGGRGTVTFNSHTWTGLGSLLSVTTPEDSSNVEAKGITVTISGLDPTLLPNVLLDYKLGLPAIVYLGFFDDAGTLIDTPVIAWSGRMDQPTLSIGGTEATAAINCENRLIDMNISVARRYTNEDQQRDWPGDLCFQFVNGLQERTLFWGQFPNSTNNI